MSVNISIVEQSCIICNAFAIRALWSHVARREAQL